MYKLRDIIGFLLTPVGVDIFGRKIKLSQPIVTKVVNSKLTRLFFTYLGTFTLGSTLGGGGSWRVGVTLFGKPRSCDPSPNGDAVDVWASFLSIILSIIIRYLCWSIKYSQYGVLRIKHTRSITLG